MSNEEYIKKAEAGQALLELNAYHDYRIAGNPPCKTREEIEELERKAGIIK